MNRWMKRRIERSRARCERAGDKPQINANDADKKAGSASCLNENQKKKQVLDGHTVAR